VLLDAGVDAGGACSLVTIIGGPDDAVDRARPVLETSSKAVIHCGGLRTGHGHQVRAQRRHLLGLGRDARGRVDSRGERREPPVQLEVMESATRHYLALVKSQADGYSLSEAMAASTNDLAQRDTGAAPEFAAEVGITTPIR
jgi:3-hydroxyisobutyrate dehydrogenase